MASGSNSSSPRSPPASKWPRGLDYLLNSSTGKDMFLDYLRNEAEGLNIPMLFLLAVEGLQEDAEVTAEGDLINSIRGIYTNLLPSVSCLSAKATENIEAQMASPDVTIYDDAVAEVKEYLARDLFPNFLKSEFYFAAINQQYNIDSREPASQLGTAAATGCEPCEVSIEVAGPSSAASSKRNFDKRHRFQELLPVQEEETVKSRKHHKPFQLTEDRILKTQHDRAKITNQTESAQLNPYAKYSSYNPVSRQDSEIRSTSSGHTDDSVGKSRARSGSNQDNLPQMEVYQPSKREYYLWAEKNPAKYAQILIPKLEEVKRMSTEERFKKLQPSWISASLQESSGSFNSPQLRSFSKRNISRPGIEGSSGSVKPQPRPVKQKTLGPAVEAGLTATTASQPRHGKQAGYGLEVSNKTLEQQLMKLAASSRLESEEPDEDILDQHVQRVWKDPTPIPLLKGNSMQTLDSGIGGDKNSRSYKVRPQAPAPRRPTKQFVELGVIDENLSLKSSRGDAAAERPKSGELQFRNLPPPIAGVGTSQQFPHRKHSPPSEEVILVYVRYEHAEEEPFRIKIPKNRLTLGYLKGKVPKKGNWKYLFQLGDADDKKKKINYELKYDEEKLPMYNDCVVVILKSVQPQDHNVV